MDGDGGDAMIADGDRCLGLPNLSRVKMDPRWMSSPSRSLPKMRGAALPLRHLSPSLLLLSRVVPLIGTA